MDELISAMPKNRHRTNGNSKAAALLDAVDYLKEQEATVKELGDAVAQVRHSQRQMVGSSLGLGT